MDGMIGLNEGGMTEAGRPALTQKWHGNNLRNMENKPLNIFFAHANLNCQH